MIDYYSVDPKYFNNDNLKDHNQVELIRCLLNRVISSNIRLVSDSENNTIKLLKENLKFISSLNSQKSIEKKLKHLFLNNKIRRSKFNNKISLEDSLNKFPFYKGKIVFNEQEVEDSSHLLIERNNDHTQEDQRIQAEGVKFKYMENNDPLIKTMLGSTYLYFGVFNFIDNIFYEGDKKNQKKINQNIYFYKKELSESLEYFMKIFSEAQDDENNFMYNNNDQKKLYIYCSTKQKSLDSIYKSKMHEALNKFYSEDLLNRKYINTFVENGGKISIFIFPSLNFDNDENEDREDLHERFFKTQNGIFSLSKDIDIFRYKNDKYIRKPIKFGYYSDYHPFATKLKVNNFDTPPFQINLEN